MATEILTELKDAPVPEGNDATVILQIKGGMSTYLREQEKAMTPSDYTTAKAEAVRLLGEFSGERREVSMTRLHSKVEALQDATAGVQRQREIVSSRPERETYITDALAKNTPFVEILLHGTRSEILQSQEVKDGIAGYVEIYLLSKAPDFARALKENPQADRMKQSMAIAFMNKAMKSPKFPIANGTSGAADKGIQISSIGGIGEMLSGDQGGNSTRDALLKQVTTLIGESAEPLVDLYNSPEGKQVAPIAGFLLNPAAIEAYKKGDKVPTDITEMAPTDLLKYLADSQERILTIDAKVGRMEGMMTGLYDAAAKDGMEGSMAYGIIKFILSILAGLGSLFGLHLDADKMIGNLDKQVRVRKSVQHFRAFGSKPDIALFSDKNLQDTRLADVLPFVEPLDAKGVTIDSDTFWKEVFPNSNADKKPITYTTKTGTVTCNYTLLDINDTEDFDGPPPRKPNRKFFDKLKEFSKKEGAIVETKTPDAPVTPAPVAASGAPT